ncbi:MAG: hypothetical protein WD894_19465 [Pirellulales bacterium]
MTEEPTIRRFPRLLRLPSFGVALGASVAALLAFAIWMFVDASFLVMLDVVRIDLGLEKHPGVDMSDVYAWDQLGSRLVLFAVLVGIGVLTTLLVFYRILFGRRQSRSLRSLFLAVALVGLWLALGVSHERLESAALQWRLGRAVQGLKQDAAILTANWPTTEGVLPYLGQYVVADAYLLLVEWPQNDHYSMREIVGPCISRSPNGALRVDFLPDKIEYHPNGGKPTSFMELPNDNRGFPNDGLDTRYVLESYVELEPNWFLVSYLPDIELPPEDSQP